MSSSSVVAGVILTVAAVSLNWLFMGPAVTGLNILLIISLVAWSATRAGRTRLNRLVGPLFVSSIVIQCFHFVEEYMGRVYEILPAVFSLKPLESRSFLLFNLIWFGIFLVAAVGVFKRNSLALLAVWFMALVSGIGNPLIHGWHAIQTGGYAPGLATALVNLPVGVALVMFLTGSIGHDERGRSDDS